ncbi:Early nodulin-like protein 1 [Glycine soja]|nr:Early nodulin-like protein 1 [Glycine soja]
MGGDLGWHEHAPTSLHFIIIGMQGTVFVYQNDSVMSVEKWNYFHCDSNSPIDIFDDGNSTVILEGPGVFYFISGTEDHCQNSEKLIVEVMSPHSIPNSPPPQAQGFSSLAPSPSHSSGVSVSILLGSVFMALLTTFPTLNFSSSGHSA